MADYKQQISRLEKENIKLKASIKTVEAQNNWHTSIWSKLYRTLMTYVLFASTLYIIQRDEFYIEALVPTSLYFALLVLKGFVKNLWLKRQD